MAGAADLACQGTFLLTQAGRTSVSCNLGHKGRCTLLGALVVITCQAVTHSHMARGWVKALAVLVQGTGLVFYSAHGFLAHQAVNCIALATGGAAVAAHTGIVIGFQAIFFLECAVIVPLGKARTQGTSSHTAAFGQVGFAVSPNFGLVTHAAGRVINHTSKAPQQPAAKAN